MLLAVDKQGCNAAFHAMDVKNVNAFHSTCTNAQLQAPDFLTLCEQRGKGGSTVVHRLVDVLQDSGCGFLKCMIQLGGGSGQVQRMAEVQDDQGLTPLALAVQVGVLACVCCCVLVWSQDGYIGM